MSAPVEMVVDVTNADCNHKNERYKILTCAYCAGEAEAERDALKAQLAEMDRMFGPHPGLSLLDKLAALGLAIQNQRTMMQQIIMCCGTGFSRKQVAKMAAEALDQLC